MKVRNFVNRVKNIIKSGQKLQIFADAEGWIQYSGTVWKTWDWEQTPIQMKTSSELGSDDVIEVDRYTEELFTSGTYGGGVIIKFASKAQFCIYGCTQMAWSNPVFKDLPVAPPTELNKIWTFTKTSSALIVTCNGVEVLNYEFNQADAHSDCIPKLVDTDCSYIHISQSYNSGLKFYRQKPTNYSGKCYGSCLI